jgi:hypothetical protein
MSILSKKMKMKENVKKNSFHSLKGIHLNNKLLKIIMKRVRSKMMKKQIRNSFVIILIFKMVNKIMINKLKTLKKTN